MKIRARWLLPAGVALVAVALGGEHAVENDPVVTLNVVQEAPDGACTVRRRDPLNRLDPLER
ncbi:hypothetical protein [Streptomyces sp. NPDC096323]|uniref:hypothetical protein n=1 Tax=Streptomyces sp. NPDC096323 TaxID=3155822 RepID=UPI0033256DCD